MTALTANCPVCRGRGWVRADQWPTECANCTPTKQRAGRTVLDQQRVCAILKRRESDRAAQARRGFIPEPAFVDAPTRAYDYD